MQKRKMFSMFYTFLKEEDVFPQFIANIRARPYITLMKKYGNGSDKKLLLYYIANCLMTDDSRRRLLSRAFSWADTPQHDSFWRNLHHKWLNKLDDYERRSK